jgi:hypothetical protein
VFLVKIAACLIIGAFPLLATRARAQDVPEPAGYREAIDEAVSEFAARRFDESRSLFAHAHALFPNARTLRGLGLAEFELRQYDECTRHLQAALRSTMRPLEGELRADTESLLERGQRYVARYTLRIRPPDAKLLVDGAPPLELEADHLLILKLGVHTLDVHANGFEPNHLQLQVTGGEQQTLDIHLERPAVATNRDAPTEHSAWYESPWLWLSVGVVVSAGAVVGIALATSNHDKMEPALGGTSGVVIDGF